MANATDYIGRPTSRVDGRAKVTGGAKYAGEFNVPGLAYGVVVSSAIAKGKITVIDASAALALKGVLKVFTHENTSGLAWFDRSYKDDIAPGGSPFRPLGGADIFYSGQPVALVVAENFELARYASTLVRMTYDEQPHETDLKAKHTGDYSAPSGKEGYQPPPNPRGDADAALAKASARIDAEYSTPTEHHNPMEPFATTVLYGDDGALTIYDKTQGVQNNQRYVSKVFGLSAKEARVLSPFVGGAFGSGLRPQYQLFLAVLAARELKRSVRVTLTRQQMFTFSYRPMTMQGLALGATSDGWLEAIKHEALGETSRFEDFTEVIVNWSTHLYRCPNVRTSYRLEKLDKYTPADMRAPGATPGVFALECAMDELAYKVGLDPLEFRLKNYAEKDLNLDKPYSSKELRACYKQGAENFGWAKRNGLPRSMRRGKDLVGWGVATGIWDAMQGKAGAQARLTREGKLTVGSATSDIGTGTYTIMTQIAASTLGLPLEDVTFQLGDSTLPMSPVEGGSWTASSNGTAVKQVCEKIGAQLLKFAQGIDGSPLAKAKAEDVVFAEGELRLRSDKEAAVSICEAMRAGGVEAIEESVTRRAGFVEAKELHDVHALRRVRGGDGR